MEKEYLTVRQLIKELLDCDLDSFVCLQSTGERFYEVFATEVSCFRIPGTSETYVSIAHEGQEFEN